VTDREVSLYLPLLWPVTMALVGAFFWGVWGDSRPTKVTPVIAPATPTAPATVPPPSPNVIDVLIDLVQPGDGRIRVEIADIHRAYAEACNAGGTDVGRLKSSARRLRLSPKRLTSARLPVLARCIGVA
jgi:hypothetical protein